MAQAVRNIAVRYNLNEEQTAYTHELMKREVTRFLKEHEDKVWPLLRDLLARQLGPPDKIEDAERLGKAAQPLAKLAEKAIFDANDEWGHILTEDQRKVHDYDLREMRKTFEKIHTNFDRWAAGTPGDQGVFPPAQDPALGPPRPKKPAAGLPKPEGQHFNVGIFGTYVEEFIKDYRLEKGQIDSARSILKEFKVKANAIKNGKKQEFAQVAAKLSDAIKKRSREEIREATVEHKKLLEPVYALFAQMETRLKGLLTTAQVERYVQQTASSAAKSKPAGSKPKTAETTPKTTEAKPDGTKPKSGDAKPRTPTVRKKQTTPKKTAAAQTKPQTPAPKPDGDRD